jgi:hypothetical protein
LFTIVSIRDKHKPVYTGDLNMLNRRRGLQVIEEAFSNENVVSFAFF